MSNAIAVSGPSGGSEANVTVTPSPYPSVLERVLSSLAPFPEAEAG